MSEKRKINHHDGRSAAAAKKKRYMGGQHRRGGSNEIRGPGLWITCDRRKEAKTVTEAYDILNEAADRLYPRPGGEEAQNDAGADIQDDIEDQIARELESIQGVKGKGKKDTARFTSVKTDVECLIWISFAPPIDPVAITNNLVQAIQDGAPTRTRHIQRLTPVTKTAHADADALKNLAYRVLQDTFAPPGYTEKQRGLDPMITYRIEPSLRNHSGKLNRDIINQVVGGVIHDLTTASFQYPRHDSETAAPAIITIASEASDNGVERQLSIDHASEEVAADAEALSSVIPASGALPPSPLVQRPILPTARRKTKVDLKNPTHTILISALKGICGMSIVTDYDKKKRFNLQMLATNAATLASDKTVQSPTHKSSNDDTIQTAIPPHVMED